MKKKDIIGCQSDSIGDYCPATPKILVKDNWGKCNDRNDDASILSPCNLNDSKNWMTYDTRPGMDQTNYEGCCPNSTILPCPLHCPHYNTYWPKSIRVYKK